jgi:hypothetical protein
MKATQTLVRLALLSAVSVGVISVPMVATTPAAHAQSVVQSLGNGTIDWTKGAIKVTGSGAAPAKGSDAQKRLMARRAAVADGYRQLAELINGVRVDSETVVRDFVTESDVIRTQVSALIKGAQIGDTRYLSDGSVEVDVTLGMYGPSESLSAAMKPVLTKKLTTTTTTTTTQSTTSTSTSNQIEIGQPDIPRQPDTPRQPEVSQPVSPSGKRYSGVIIDCRGLGVQPAMSPSIVDGNGKEIYIGNRPVDPDMVVNIGIVGYAKTLDSAQKNSRIGGNPLIIKASKAGGRLKSDAVLAGSGAQELMAADASLSFLSDAKVVFVID